MGPWADVDQRVLPWNVEDYEAGVNFVCVGSHGNLGNALNATSPACSFEFLAPTYSRTQLGRGAMDRQLSPISRIF